MTLMRRFLCWDLRTASFIGYVTLTITTVFALLLRMLDMAAILTDFEISQGFQTPWRSHQWQAFLASDCILMVFHLVTIIMSIYMLILINNMHFVMYQSQMRLFLYYHCLYMFIEFCFSVFEFSFYGLNTFRLAYVVFIWLYWLIKTTINVTFACVLYSRCEEMADHMSMELRFSEKQRLHSYA